MVKIFLFSNWFYVKEKILQQHLNPVLNDTDALYPQVLWKALFYFPETILIHIEKLYLMGNNGSCLLFHSTLVLVCFWAHIEARYSYITLNKKNGSSPKPYFFFLVIIKGKRRRLAISSYLWIYSLKQLIITSYIHLNNYQHFLKSNLITGTFQCTTFWLQLSTTLGWMRSTMSCRLMLMASFTESIHFILIVINE